MTCKCNSNNAVKNGHRGGKQCWLCKACGCQFTGDSTLIKLEKRVAVTLCCFGLSMRKAGALLGYSHVTILNWVRDFEKQRDATKVASEDFFLELDEICAFLGQRTTNPKMARRFPNMQAALTHNVEHGMEAIIEKVFSSLTG